MDWFPKRKTEREAKQIACRNSAIKDYVVSQKVMDTDAVCKVIEWTMDWQDDLAKLPLGTNNLPLEDPLNEKIKDVFEFIEGGIKDKILERGDMPSKYYAKSDVKGCSEPCQIRLDEVDESVFARGIMGNISRVR